ncbi:MAG: type II secretion system F family protein [Minisyncoccales bacterium]
MEENRKKRIREEIELLRKNLDSDINPAERMMINSKIRELVKELEEKGDNNKIYEQKEEKIPLVSGKIKGEHDKRLKQEIKETEEITLKRLAKAKAKKEKKKEVKPNAYIKISNKLFSKVAIELFNENKLKSLEKDLIKSNMNITPTSYISGVLTATILSIFASIFMVILMTLVMEGDSIINLTKTFWIIFVVPFVTFVGGYVYPSLEKESVQSKINQEIPFATIHMSAISGSMIEPSKIFQIIISTKEYETLEKEFTKIMNGINIYGYNLVGSLKKTAERTASKKFSELLNSMSTTITSGGNLVEFFDKRSKSLLFDYKLERERKSKQAETFMDIYISVVIAAPMIFMLLLVMMQISGLGIEISNSLISLLMILGVSLVNAIFIGFLYIRGT